MFFSSFAEFIKMGTHGPYVWSAYFIVIFSFFILFFITHKRHKRLKRKIKKLKTNS